MRYIHMTITSVLHMTSMDSLLHAWLQTMFVATYSPEEGWRGSLKPYQCLQLEPSAQVLNYGQSVFEGLKAQRSEQGRVVLFRPDQNAARMQAGRLPLTGLLARMEWTKTRDASWQALPL